MEIATAAGVAEARAVGDADGLELGETITGLGELFELPHAESAKTASAKDAASAYWLILT